MHHYFEAITNTSGDSLVGYFGRVINRANNNTVTLASDDNGTPIIVVSGVENMAKTDDFGNLDFYVEPGTYDLEIYAPNATSLIMRVPNVAMSSSKGDRGDPGPEGPQGEGLADVIAPSGAQKVGARLWAFSRDETVYDVLRRVVWVESFFTDDLTADQTAAFQAAFDAVGSRGGEVRCRTSVTVGTTDPIELPAEPKVIRLICEAPLLQGAPNKPMIRKKSEVSRVVDAYVRVTVTAHPFSSPTNPANIAVNLVGFDYADVRVRFVDPAGVSATTGRFAIGIYGNANLPFCYNNNIKAVFHQCWLPGRDGIKLDNGGGGVLSNANLNFISVWAYSCAGNGDVIDIADTTQTIVRSSLIESCNDAVGIRAGNFTTTEHNWFENVGKTIVYGPGNATLANNCISYRDQFSGSNTVVIDSNVAAVPEFLHSLFGGMTFIDQNGTATKRYSVVRTYTQPNPPQITFVIGGPAEGALSVQDGPSVRQPIDHHGCTTYRTVYAATPPGAGRAVLRILPPTGFEVQSANVSVERPGQAAPLTVGLSNALNSADYSFWWPDTNPHTINLAVTLRPSP